MLSVKTKIAQQSAGGKALRLILFGKACAVGLEGPRGAGVENERGEVTEDEMVGWLVGWTFFVWR